MIFFDIVKTPELVYTIRMDIESFFNKALSAQKDNNTVLAKTLYQEILDVEPTHLPTLFNLGTVLANEYDFKAAKLVFQKLIALEPDYVRALFNCAWCCLQIREVEEAKDYLRHAVSLVPEYAAAQHLLGSILIKEGAFSEAEQHLTLALQEDPSLAEAYCHLGMVKIHQQEDETARSLLEQAITLEPFQAEAHYHLALIQLKRQELSAAENSLQNALDRDPMHFAALYNMALLKKQQHFYGIADEYLARAQAIKPEDSHVLFLRASLREDNTEMAAPISFVSNLFDGYAAHYDDHMLRVLQYQAHEQLAALLPKNASGLSILDLGCGTGLCGPLFKPFAKHLVGVDLSAPMLAHAREKNCYDVLIEGDIIDVLNKMEAESIDLCIAADVLGYIGKLDALFEAVARVLKPQGLFLFSVELGHSDIQLNHTTRFTHSKDYIERLSDQVELQIQTLNPGVLRQQEGSAVEGYYISAVKT